MGSLLMNTYKEFLNRVEGFHLVGEYPLDPKFVWYESRKVPIELLRRVLSDEDRMTVLGDIKYFLQKEKDETK